MKQVPLTSLYNLLAERVINRLADKNYQLRSSDLKPAGFFLKGLFKKKNLQPNTTQLKCFKEKITSEINSIPRPMLQ